jgi:hypothetical protein
MEDGSWSPPSGIMLHTAGLGFLVGIDIYDCVLVINNRKALESFTKLRATLGGEISAVAGPAGIGGLVENDGKWKQANRPVFTYLKSRGFYAGVQMDGTIVIERSDENARFYGETISVNDILAGKARHPPPEIKTLMETLKAAEGRSDYDQDLVEELGTQPAPSDFDVQQPGHEHVFGIPEPDDPDPYGVAALHSEGLDIVTAGSRTKPSDEEFEFHPSPHSPVYAKYQRRSVDLAQSSTKRSSNTSTPLRGQDEEALDKDKPRSIDTRAVASEDIEVSQSGLGKDAPERNYSWSDSKNTHLDNLNHEDTNEQTSGAAIPGALETPAPDLNSDKEGDPWDLSSPTTVPDLQSLFESTSKADQQPLPVPPPLPPR